MLVKTFKIIGSIFLVIIGVILLFIGIVWASISWGQAQKKRERITYQKEICDTMRNVDSQFQIMLGNFNTKELKNVTFYIIRNHQIWKSQMVKVSFDSNSAVQKTNIPFRQFLTSDTIAVKVSNCYFLLSGLKYVAYQNYGMFGPVGPCDCALDQFELLNGKSIASQVLYLNKKEAILNYQLPN